MGNCQRELKKILPELQCDPMEEASTPADVASVVREEVREALAPPESDHEFQVGLNEVVKSGYWQIGVDEKDRKKQSLRV